MSAAIEAAFKAQAEKKLNTVHSYVDDHWPKIEQAIVREINRGRSLILGAIDITCLKQSEWNDAVEYLKQLIGCEAVVTRRIVKSKQVVIDVELLSPIVSRD